MARNRIFFNSFGFVFPGVNAKVKAPIFSNSSDYVSNMSRSADEISFGGGCPLVHVDLRVPLKTFHYPSGKRIPDCTI